ncbi:MAG: DUF72 domain-containing protein [Saprospiraceae bacterium]
MKFGKEDIPAYHFSPLPDARLWTDRSASAFKVFIGSTNWTERYWKDNLYPPGTKPSMYLNLYSRTFNCIELNTTFYRTPDSEQVIKWKEQTPDGFRFCPKVNSRISQSRLLGMDSNGWESFWDSMSHFGDQLGSCFLQLPEFFDESRRTALFELITGQWVRPGLMIELRHASWFKDLSLMNDLCQLLAGRQCGLVITDTPGRQDVRHLEICSHSLLVRYVSDGNEINDKMRLEDWKKNIANLRKEAAVQFIFHHPDASVMIRCAKEWNNYFNS